MTIKVCVALTASSMRDLKSMIGKAERDGADIMEIRMDYLQEKPNLEDIRNSTELPLIATNRIQNEGGLFQGPEEERISMLMDAASSGFNFVDVESTAKNCKRVVRRLKESGAKTIVSHHILHMTPSLSEINQIFKRELDVEGDIFKIITMARKIEDNLTCLRFLAESSKAEDVVCFCMGELGKASRLLSPLFGSRFTYASIGSGAESAVGQLTVAEMRRFYELLGL
jgi:3-dehydroquinate dehydratase type I